MRSSDDKELERGLRGPDSTSDLLSLQRCKTEPRRQEYHESGIFVASYTLHPSPGHFGKHHEQREKEHIPNSGCMPKMFVHTIHVVATLGPFGARVLAVIRDA
jgi:hypothetical protein